MEKAPPSAFLLPKIGRGTNLRRDQHEYRLDQRILARLFQAKPVRRVNLVVRSQGNDLAEARRHGEERKRERDDGRLHWTRRSESALENLGPVRPSKVSLSSRDLAAPSPAFK